MDVVRWDASNDGPLSEAALARKLEKLGYGVNCYVYPPGTHFPAHSHSVDKMDAVVSGRFRIQMGKDSVILEAGDAMAVPAGAEHSAEVVGGEAVISLDGISNVAAGGGVAHNRGA
jgi:quercetin dioxygenase-like cupin family protein